MATKKRAPSRKSSKAKQGAASSPKPTKELMSALREFVRNKGSQYLKDPNIQSIGIGYKIKDGKRTDEIAVRFSVGQKAKLDLIEALGSERIPESLTVNGIEVPTDVVERHYAVEYQVVAESAVNERKVRIDPIMGGISVCNVNGTAGTVGCIVYDAVNGTPYVLSNWHILHGPFGAVGDVIVQPGPHDDNRIQLNRLGRLVRSHLGAAGDCAVASIEDRRFLPEILELGVKVASLGVPELGDKVIKSGRTTGVTHGIVTVVDMLTSLNYGGLTGIQEIGGFEIGLDSDFEPADGEISKGGDSGSAWMFKAADGKTTTILAGLHFAGEGPGDPNEHAVACYPKSVFEKLQISLSPPAVAAESAGLGYSKSFLADAVDHPKLSASNKPKAFKLNGTETIDYTHFSLAINKERRFPFWVAWNIDGNGLRSLSRKSIPFILDPRIPEEFQVGNELYAGNRLDRGHIARRADLLWGSLAEAQKANRDSFFFTNITPQMDDFNQSSKGGLWGSLEDAVFADTEVEQLRISVFGGPIFKQDDRVFRGVPVPREFWKLIAFVEGGVLKAKAFVLTQSLDELEALDLDEFRVFQVAVTEIESRAGLVFPAMLRSADTVGEAIMRRPEAAGSRKPLASLSDIDWS